MSRVYNLNEYPSGPKKFIVTVAFAVPRNLNH